MHINPLDRRWEFQGVFVELWSGIYIILYKIIFAAECNVMCRDFGLNSLGPLIIRMTISQPANLIVFMESNYYCYIFIVTAYFGQTWLPNTKLGVVDWVGNKYFVVNLDFLYSQCIFSYLWVSNWRTPITNTTPILNSSKLTVKKLLEQNEIAITD